MTRPQNSAMNRHTRCQLYIGQQDGGKIAEHPDESMQTSAQLQCFEFAIIVTVCHQDEYSIHDTIMSNTVPDLLVVQMKFSCLNLCCHGSTSGSYANSSLMGTDSDYAA